MCTTYKLINKRPKKLLWLFLEDGAVDAYVMPPTLMYFAAFEGNDGGDGRSLTKVKYSIPSFRTVYFLLKRRFSQTTIRQPMVIGTEQTSSTIFSSFIFVCIVGGPKGGITREKGSVLSDFPLCEWHFWIHCWAFLESSSVHVPCAAFTHLRRWRGGASWRRGSCGHRKNGWPDFFPISKHLMFQKYTVS